MNLLRLSKALVLALLGTASPGQELGASTRSVELPDEVHAEVTRLSGRGDEHAERGDYPEAIANYAQALALLPAPITAWEASTWLLTAIGDAHFNAGSYELARTALSDAMHCPGAIGNPFIHLRLGQVQFELGNMTRANDELARAYLGGGKEIFASENPKYFAHLKTVLAPPASGEW